MSMMRYTEPTLEVVTFEVEDVVCTSEPEVSLEAPLLDDDVFQ